MSQDNEQEDETGDTGYVSPDEWERDPEHYAIRAQESRARIVDNALNNPRL